jgi:hypothetical protein
MSYNNLNQIQKARLESATAVTAAQIEKAKHLLALHFGGTTSPELTAAIVSAIAANYATTVLSNGE